MRATVFFVFLLSLFFLADAGARERRKPPPRFKMGCNCFAQTVELKHSNYYGHVFGFGDSEQEAYDDAVRDCREKPSVVREGGATWLSVQRCVIID